MKLIFVALLCVPMWAQQNTFRVTVRAYQWTTTHKTLTFSWPGYANTSCSGNSNMNGYVSGSGNIYASGTSSDTCSTTYTPPSSQNIDIQKPVVYILADTESSRMLLTCTRNVRWSQCQALNPGTFLARIDHGHFEVQGLSGKGKEEWVKFDIVQQTAISGSVSQGEKTGGPYVPKKLDAATQAALDEREGRAAPAGQSQTDSTQEAPASIEAPNSAGANSGFPARWKSMTTGLIRTLRFEGEYVYGEVVLPDAAAKAGVFYLMDAKKDGDKYVGKTNMHILSAPGGKSCLVTLSIELTRVMPERIEGRSLAPPPNSKIDWDTCTYSSAAEWQVFTWIPVR